MLCTHIIIMVCVFIVDFHVFAHVYVVLWVKVHNNNTFNINDGHGTPTYIACMGLCVFYILYDRADIVCQTLLFSYFTP